jgi:hypothetical protein
MTEAIVAAVKEDRFARIRRRSYAASIGVIAALAASVLLIAWATTPTPRTQGDPWLPHVGPDVAKPAEPDVAPAPRPAPERPPIRFGDEFAKASEALRGAEKSIVEPASAAPDVFAKLSQALSSPMTDPMADMAPARSALADLPEVARTGLEPVTGPAQKAFTRLLNDIGGVSVKPKS